MNQTPVSASMSVEQKKALYNTGKRPGLLLQKIDARNGAVKANNKSTKKVLSVCVGRIKMKDGLPDDKPGTPKKVNSQITKKRKKPASDAHIETLKCIKKTRMDTNNERKNSEIIGSSKGKQRGFPKGKSTDETCDPRKGVKQKSSEKGKSTPKLKKIELCPTTSITVIDSASKRKNKLSIPSFTKSAATTQNEALKQNSKIAQVKLSRKSQAKQPNSAVSCPSHKASKKHQAVKTKQESVGSLKKKAANSEEKARVGISKHHDPDIKSTTVPSVDISDPMALLMMMEGRAANHSVSRIPSVMSASTSYAVASASDGERELDEQTMSTSEGETEEMSDWEEVYDHHVADKSQIPDGPVEITLEMPDILKNKKRQKKTFDWKAHLERRVKRFKKEVAADMHKVHLLCLLALGLRQNEILNDPTVKAVMLSLLPSNHLASTKLGVQQQVENLLLWYKRKFSLENVSHCSSTQLVAVSPLIDAVSQETITDARIWILIFISMLRTVGLTVRLVLSFQPMRFKSHQGWDEKKGGKVKHHRTSTDHQSKGDSPASTSKTKTAKTSSLSKQTKSRTVSKKAQVPKRELSRRESSKKAMVKNKNALRKLDVDDDDDDDDYFDPDLRINDGDDEDSDFSERGMKKMKEANAKKKMVSTSHNDSSSESENDESRSSLSSPQNVFKGLKILSNRKILSPSTSDDEAAGGKRHGLLGHDVWLEVYFPEAKKWNCFDCFKSRFGKPYTIEKSATQPLMYVLGFKNDNSVKDVTARYAKQWLSHTRKNRTDQDWWTGTLFMFDSTTSKDNLIEDDEIKGHLLVQPMPTSIAEFKNHPLYVLQRHLLKFEAIYPETAIPLGYIKKEPIYARECVHTLHSRQNWLKEGRLVRLNENPYKMVKSRPKWNKPKDNPDALDLQLFGEWQTERYIPPPAVNGKVPRNEYGNVELFKPWMLPTGTVQIRGHGMQRVAKKLNIDIAAAMTGWDNHSGFSHPLMDGWIVCEEFADTLMVAWLDDQEIQKQRETEKREKRVYDNWRLLIRGLLIRERLRTKFLQVTPPVVTLEKQETFSDAEEACDVHQSWPRNRQDQMMHEKSNAVHLKAERERKVVETGRDPDVQAVNVKDEGTVKAEIGKKVLINDASVSGGRKKVQDIVRRDGKTVGKKAMKPEQGKVKKKRNSIEDEDSDFVISDKHSDKKKVVTAFFASGGKRRVAEIVCSESSSSEDEIVDSRLVKPEQGKMKKKRSSIEDDDPDFDVNDKDGKTQKKKYGKGRPVAIESDEEVGDDAQERGSKRRASLARGAKNREKYVDKTSDSDSEVVDEVDLSKRVVIVVEDVALEVVDGKSRTKKSSNIRSGRKKQTRKMKHVEEEAEIDFEEDQIKIRKGDEVGVDKVKTLAARSDGMPRTRGGVAESAKSGGINVMEENKRHGTRSRLRSAK